MFSRFFEGKRGAATVALAEAMLQVVADYLTALGLFVVFLAVMSIVYPHILPLRIDRDDIEQLLRIALGPVAFVALIRAMRLVRRSITSPAVGQREVA